MRIRTNLSVDDAAIADFCERHGIRRLALFGSVLRGDFSDASDIDVLVEFLPGKTPGLLTIAGMELELSSLLDSRDVEIRTYEDLSPYFRDTVRSTAVPLYAAA
ncbi:nucleotidyltransferase family protein [Haloechinothrix salitolerans]|uniref:Nucleotidyltransferase family protein n=1 Tax=Haloechinothrix salitolerans TaxID=926830 RepID=A0ABW2BZS0_9PSEU